MDSRLISLFEVGMNNRFSPHPVDISLDVMHENHQVIALKPCQTSVCIFVDVRTIRLLGKYLDHGDT